MAWEQGFGPRLTRPERVVLPLNDSQMSSRRSLPRRELNDDNRPTSVLERTSLRLSESVPIWGIGPPQQLERLSARPLAFIGMNEQEATREVLGALSELLPEVNTLSIVQF